MDWIPDFPLDLESVWWLVLAIVVLALLIFFVLPILIFLVELLVFAIAVAVVVAIRVVARRPWTIEAVSDDGTRTMTWRATGLAAARRAVHELAEALERGQRHVQPDRTQFVGERQGPVPSAQDNG